MVATIAGTASLVQGTFERPRAARKTIATTADIAGFAFPYVKGHMRARVASSITATKSSYASGTILFDAGDSGKIPARVYSGCSTFTGTCRRVFTNTNAVPADGRTWHPARVDLNDGNASAIGALIAPASEVPGIGAAGWRTIVRKVLDGDLKRPRGLQHRALGVAAPQNGPQCEARRPSCDFGAAAPRTRTGPRGQPGCNRALRALPRGAIADERHRSSCRTCHQTSCSRLWLKLRSTGRIAR